MSALPQQWATSTIGEVAEVNPPRSPGTDIHREVSFVPMPAVDEVSGSIVQHIRRPAREVSKGYTSFREEDVIFAKITPCMENGKAAIARDLINGVGFGSTEFHVLRSSDALVPDFLWRFLRQQSFRDDAAASMTGAVGQRRVPTEFLRNQSIPVPPVAEQKRIVAKVDGLTARTARARRELDQIPELIESYKSAILNAAFSGDLTADWRALHGLSLPSEVYLEQVVEDFAYGTSARSSKIGRIPVLRMGNIQNGKLDWSDLVYTDDESERKKYALKAGDVLFNRTNSPELVGKTALYNGEREAIYAGYLIRIRCSERLSPAYLTYALNAPAGRQYCWAVKSDGVSQSNINAKKLGKFPLLVPELPEQTEIVRRLDASFKWLEVIIKESSRATGQLPQLDQAILAKAFRGGLVPQDPADEPASVLLDRIRAERAAAPTRKRKARA